MALTVFHPSLSRSATVSLVATLVSVLLGGCAGPRVLRSSYVDYAESFATASNQQLLLNMARLDNAHPPHFLQMGSVTAQFSFEGGLAGRYVDISQGNPTTRSLDLSLRASEKPTFNFTPLSGGAYSDVLLTPIKPQVLYSLVSQNLPISTMMRLMVERVTVTYENGIRASFRNRFNKDNLDNFADFLRVTAHLERLSDDDVLDLTVDEKTGIWFRLSPETQRVMRKRFAADPRYKLVTFDPQTGKGTAEIGITTRSFLGVLLGVVREAPLFDRLPSSFKQGLPELVREPILRIARDPAYTEPPIAKVKYAGKRYVISDRPGSRINRANFSMVVFLNSQTQLDPDKVPTPQFIQVQ